MRIRTRVLVTALVHLILIGVAIVIFLGFEFRAGMKSILLAPGEARLRLLAYNLTEELRAAPASGHDAIVDRMARSHGVQLGLFINTGEHVAGSIRELPEAVRRELIGPPVESSERAPRIPRKAKGPKGKNRKAEDGPPGPQHPVRMFAESSPRRYWFSARVPIPDAAHEFPLVGTLVISASNIAFTPLLLDLRPWLLFLAAMAAITIGCWVPLIHSLTKSVRRIHAATERYARGEFQSKLPAVAGGEIREMAESLNRMAAQLDGFVHGQKRFLGDIAHELSAPIARTQAAICILEENVDRQPERRYLEGLREEVDQMSDLVRELLQFSKAGLSSGKAAPQVLDARTMAEKAIARESPEEGRVSLLPGEPAHVVADAEGILRALCNVVRSAIRYAGDAGGITVSVQRRPPHVLIVVADQGPGMPEEALEQAFQPFFRLDSSRSRESGGAGLGLAIVKASVESSGGAVWCRNRPEGGLEVTIRLDAAGEAFYPE
jgi:two-component system sensor histidine kinase CpxA